jgi:hypothetical protein
VIGLILIDQIALRKGENHIENGEGHQHNNGYKENQAGEGAV